jgi:transcription-repair coupling factor (superfamily II helicase)
MKILKDNSELLNIFSSESILRRAKNRLENNNILTVNNAKGSSAHFLPQIISGELNSPVIIICGDEKECVNVVSDLETTIPEQKIAGLFEPIKHTRNHTHEEKSNLAWLLEAISIIIEDANFIAVCTPKIFETNIPETDIFIDYSLEISKNQHLDFNRFTGDLLLGGFERTDYVAKQGEIAIRGGIVDIFPIGLESPLRIEFWGDEIDSIRQFDPLSQRSIKSYDSVSFLGKIPKLEDNNKNNSRNNIFSILPDNTIFASLNPDLIFQKVEKPEKINFYKQILINSLSKADIKLQSAEQISFNSHVQDFAKFLIEKINLGFGFHILAESRSHITRIAGIIESTLENNFDFDENKINFLFDKIHWHKQTISSGFSLEDKYFVFTEHQIFERQRIAKQRIAGKKENKQNTEFNLREINSLKIGDFVVHEDKGVARFEGFRNVTIGRSAQDCVQLIFEGGDKLFVNMNFLNKIQKYSAAEGDIPKLHKLGSAQWQKKKNSTKKKIKDIARKLIKLYAARKLQQGFAFPTDTTWQKEFEASFLWDDTIDQISATSDIKKDMEDERPMDRLLCGDVGFGKTELAIRSAFKAVQAGKQVAVLVPTTVLAQQHFMTFRDRLSRYPVNIAVLSRFRTQKELKESISGIKSGQIDIAIGTHRILSKDIEFKDLGLLVVDEEQRFGVSAKEKLREMKVSVDTLTLTATPIPRTLNFSLMGARDLSIIETPPRNRLPVYTEILEWDTDFLTRAIDKEIGRGGQVFFVSDRVADLEKIMIDLKMLMPTYNFEIAHGQMKPAEIEKVMQNFISGKIDVLITTKIVESGLDIPNANTMIINRASNFGLAELYQLRGRVGRTNIQAYCYLMLKKNAKPSPTAIKRLQAIEEFTDLGSGFQLARRDMEIRGAGNLLGGEQSGLIFDIGFELYQKILEETVRELKKEEFSNTFDSDDDDFLELFANKDIAIEVGEDAFLPDKFIPTDTERFEYYKKLYACYEQKELRELLLEIEDRYGRIPREAKNLFFAVKLRIHAVSTGLSKIILKENKMICEFPPKENEDFYSYAFPQIMEFIGNIPDAKLLQGKKKLTLEIPIKSNDEGVEIIWKLKTSLEHAEYE